MGLRADDISRQSTGEHILHRARVSQRLRGHYPR